MDFSAYEHVDNQLMDYQKTRIFACSPECIKSLSYSTSLSKTFFAENILLNAK